MQQGDDDREGGDGLPFFREFLRHPLQIGAIIPSSRFLEQRILDAAGIAEARSVVELGPGTGGTTRAILRALPPQGRLLCIEINPRFHRRLGAIRDHRLIAHLGDAGALADILSRYGMDAPDAVISGIPFSTMNGDDGARLVETISNLLAPDGRFVAYQVSNRIATLCRPFLGEGQVAVELRNIPPMRVYRWEKKAH